MSIALGVLFAFAILTLWVPAYWPVSIFQVGVFVLAALGVWRRRHALPGFAYPLLPFGFAVLWGLFQWSTGRTAYAFDTQSAIVRWSTFLAVFLIGICIFEPPPVRRAFRSAMLWFTFLVSVLATLQTFTSGGRVFWIFPSGYPDHVMGPILNRNHWAAFIEVVLPIAVYEALRRKRNALLYSAMAATMYASIIASASRAGTVLATAEIVVVGLLMLASHRTSGHTIGVSLVQMAVLFVAFTAVVGWQSVWQRFWEPDPFGTRREFAVSSLHMISDHPWFGVGLGTWPTIYPRYAIIDIGAFANQAHSDWLEWTAEGGIPLGLLMLSLGIWCLGPAFRSIWGLGVIAVFLHASVDYPFSRPALGSWPILVIAMLAAARQAPQADDGPAPAAYQTFRSTIQNP